MGLRRVFQRSQWLSRVLGLVAVYAAWILALQLMVLTLVTYYLRAASSRLGEISDSVGSSEIGVAGFGALAFMLLRGWLNPMPTAAPLPITQRFRVDPGFTNGFVRGAIVALILTLAFLLTGHYRYLGSFITFEDTLIALGGVLLRIVSLLLLVVGEEILFRQVILPRFAGRLPRLAAITATSILYCAVKRLQFDLGIMQLWTLFLVSTVLGLKALKEGGYHHGAGFWSALLIVFHALLGLPIFGNEFAGILLIKYAGPLSETGHWFRAIWEGTDMRTTVFITGGLGGPLSSFVLQFLLFLQILRALFRPHATG